MTLDVSVVQALAPDQASLNAAAKLMAPKHWLGLNGSPADAIVWGECQGSGANPYRVVSDVAEHGYKCSCPSRKFPCKHALALMWQYAQDPARFTPDAPPDWVVEWMGRRRRGPGKPADDAAAPPPPKKDLAAAAAASAENQDSLNPLNPMNPPGEDEFAAAAQRAAATEKRREQTDSAVADGLVELRLWIDDQLRTGIGAFVDDAGARCRRIAARLVDAKAGNLASRVDELPARLLALPRDQQAAAAMHELAQLVLLARAWTLAPDDPDARAAVVQAPRREALMQADEACEVASLWSVVGESIQTRRDGLVAQSTWLLDRCSAAPRFALLLDYFPATAGRRQSAFEVGQQLALRLRFHPGRWPLRAIVAGSAEDAEIAPVRLEPPAMPLARHREHLAAVPWAGLTPLSLGPGVLREDPRGRAWWQSADGRHALPLTAVERIALWSSLPLLGAVVLWDGFQGELLSIDTPLGPAWSAA